MWEALAAKRYSEVSNGATPNTMVGPHGIAEQNEAE